MISTDLPRGGKDSCTARYDETARAGLGRIAPDASHCTPGVNDIGAGVCITFLLPHCDGLGRWTCKKRLNSLPR